MEPDFAVEPDPRMQLFIGGFDAAGRAMPISPKSLRRQTDRWSVTASTPEGVASLLRTSRDLFVQSFFVYEFLVVGASWSLLAVEAALRDRLASTERFQRLIDQARAKRLIDSDEHAQLDAAPVVASLFPDV